MILEVTVPLWRDPLRHILFRFCVHGRLTRIDYFRVALNLIMIARLSANVCVMKISFHSYANKINFHMKSFAHSLAFMVRFTATRKWPIDFVKKKMVFAP